MGKSRELVSFFEEMLSRQEYLIPMVAASFQYPIHYYGMTSAALLEDLFVDASINFRNNHRRDVEISPKMPDRYLRELRKSAKSFGIRLSEGLHQSNFTYGYLDVFTGTLVVTAPLLAP